MEERWEALRLRGRWVVQTTGDDWVELPAYCSSDKQRDAEMCANKRGQELERRAKSLAWFLNLGPDPEGAVRELADAARIDYREVDDLYAVVLRKDVDRLLAALAPWEDR